MTSEHFTDHLVHLTSARSTDREWRIPRFSALYPAEGPWLQGVPLIKITGTNGKGSVAAMLEACLTAAGRKVGLATSPHLERIMERIRVGGEEVGAADFARHLEGFEKFLSRFLHAHGERYVPSFFEAVLLITLRLFEEAGIDFAIFETGVGGAHDPTSVIPGFLSILTTVAFDHEAELGGTLPEIAKEKTGIANRGSQLVLGPAIAGEVRGVVEQEAARLGVRTRPASRDRVRALGQDLSGTRAAVKRGDGEVEVVLPLLGSVQLDNLATVATVADAIEEAGIPLGPAAIAGIARTRWAARLEYRPGAPSWLLDGAHNEEAIGTLAAFVQSSFADRERVLVYGTTSRKTYRRYLHLLPRIASEVLLTDDFDDAEERAVLARELAGRVTLGEAPASLEALLAQVRARPGGERRLVVIAGSLYLAGKARSWLNEEGRLREARA